jgi:hypothetical protein
LAAAQFAERVEGLVLRAEAPLVKMQAYRSGKPLRHPKFDFFVKLFAAL